MIFLGIHNGHGGSVSVVKDGTVINCIERERLIRRKHAIGVTLAEITAALDDAGVGIDDIDFCAVTSTQRLEHIFHEPDRFSFAINLEAPHAEHCPAARGLDEAAIEARSHSVLSDVLKEGRFHPYIDRTSPDLMNALGRGDCVRAIEDFWVSDAWTEPRGIAALDQVPLDDALSEEARLGATLPVDVTLDGRTIPGFLMSHHYAHAAYAFYGSDFDRAAILSHDGSTPNGPYWGGMYYYGEGNKLYSVAPHFLSQGHLYERIAFLLNLGYDTGAGKLMGLAPWGKPVFYDETFVGNFHDGPNAPLNPDAVAANTEIPHWINDEAHALLYRWLNHCLTKARELDYDLSPLGDTDKLLEPINADLAASTQKLFEETLIAVAAAQSRIQEKLGRPTENLCLTGGTALNCPANTRIHNETPFANVFVPPAVGDDGLSIGSALAVCHNICDRPRNDQGNDNTTGVYLGVARQTSAEELARLSPDITVETVDDPAREAARYLSEDKIVAWYEGRSEVGPRALGHRSLLAHPGPKANWERVNHLKKRELWRPFAPSVLAEHCDDYFEGAPVPSPYMLFTAQVTKPDALGAITHVDGSARTQTVSPANGTYYRLISSFFEMTGLPVVLNTSLNGPGEPIVETPADAVRFLTGTAVDVLFVDGYKITRN